MDCVERPDRLDGERPPGTFDDVSFDPHGAPAPGRRNQVAVEPDRLCSRQGSRGLTSDQGSVTFDECEVGCQDEFGPGKCVADEVGPRFAEQPAKDRAGLRVEVQRSPRSSSMSC